MNLMNKKAIKNSHLNTPSMTEKRLLFLVHPLPFVKDKILDFWIEACQYVEDCGRICCEVTLNRKSEPIRGRFLRAKRANLKMANFLTVEDSPSALSPSAVGRSLWRRRKLWWSATSCGELEWLGELGRRRLLAPKFGYKQDENRVDFQSPQKHTQDE